MKRHLWILATLAIAGSVVAADTKSRGTVAMVGKTAVTQEELDRAVGNRLMRIRTEEYNLRRAALDEIVVKRLLEAEAARRGITVDELTRVEVEAKVAAPAAAEIEPFYEAQKERYGSLPKAEAIAQIADSMKKHRAATRMTELIDSLRAAAQIRVMLEPPRVQLAATDGPARGNANAPVTIVEFSDYECQFCGRAAETLRKLESAYGENLRIVHRDFPLPSHRGAPRAAEAAHCAGDQGKYWEMYERLFTKGGSILESDIRKFATEIGLDAPKFSDCLASGTHTETWKSGQSEGAKLGVQSTPTFFVNGRLVSGALPYDAFAKIIDDELARATPAVSSGSK